MWYAGIDWADTNHDIVVINEAGRKVAQVRVEHSASGLNNLVRFLREIAPLDQIACIIETKHGLLITALLEAGVALYPVNPKTIDRKRSPAGAKTDQVDAYLLAKYGRSEWADLRRLDPDSPKIAELKALTRDQDSLIQSQTRLLNQLTACLKAYYPVALTLFSKLAQPSTLAFLQAYPTPEAARHATVEQIRQVLSQTGHTTAKKVAPQLYEQLHQTQLEADPVTIRTKSRLMLALVLQLSALLPQIAAYDEEITRLFLTHEDKDVFSSLPRAGKRIAPRLLAQWGDDRRRYSSGESIAALAGVSPVPWESGNYATVHQRFACVKPLRNVLYQFAWESTLQEPWAQDYYDRKRREGKSHSMALRALAQIWVRIIFAMWHKHEPYQPAIFLAAKRDHERRAA
jgi:transposase